MHGNVINEQDNHYGKLLVVEHAGSKHSDALWLCQCTCGNRSVVAGSNLRSGNTRSCGCLSRELSKARSLPEGEAVLNQIITRMKRAAKSRGYQWQLTKEQVRTLTKQHCHYCGVAPLQRGDFQDQFNGEYLYNGIDRVDNSRGYTTDNVVPCCFRCNRAKMALSLEEFRGLITKIYQHFCMGVNSPI